LKYYITNAKGDIIENIIPRKVKKEQVVHPSVEFGMLSVGSISTGSYEFHVEISDLQDKTIIHQRKKFFVYQPDEAIAGDSLRQSPVNFFRTMDSTAVEDEFLKISYLINKSTKDAWGEINNLVGKKNFLHQFWSMYATDRSVRDNKFRKEYLNRVEYANDAFRAFRKDGWKTDRGRVYMVYGQPSDIERHPNEPNAYPYEIWSYNEMQGGVIFVFADFDGYRDFRLLHSTLVGEIRDYNFMNLIRK
jgi:GWxTD domain-containing protein